MRLKHLINEGKGASLETRLQECLHSVFFGTKQKKKNTNVSTFEDVDLLESAYKTYCSLDTPFGEVYAFGVKRPDWVKAVVISMDALFKSGWLKGKYIYHRGDAYMNSIYAQFNRLKKQDGITLSNDKWNPGDIWASKGNVAIENFDTLMEYNEWIAKMLHSGKLIAISLKKVGSSAKVELVGDPKVKSEKQSFKDIRKPTKIFPTGMTIVLERNWGINVRSFGLNLADGTIRGEVVMIKGGTARHGKVPQDMIKGVIKKYNIPQMTLQDIKGTSEEDLMDKLIELWMLIGYNFPEEKILKGINKIAYRERNSYWQSAINALQLAAWMGNAGSLANEIVNSWYIGAKSKTGSSSQFIKIS